MYFIDSKTILDLFPTKKETAGEKASSSRSEKIFKSGKIISHTAIGCLLINADTIQRYICIYISKDLKLQMEVIALGNAIYFLSVFTSANRMKQISTWIMPQNLEVSVSARAHAELSNLHSAKSHLKVPNGGNKTMSRHKFKIATTIASLTWQVWTRLYLWHVSWENGWLSVATHDLFQPMPSPQLDCLRCLIFVQQWRLSRSPITSPSTHQVPDP